MISFVDYQVRDKKSYSDPSKEMVIRALLKALEEETDVVWANNFGKPTEFFPTDGCHYLRYHKNDKRLYYGRFSNDALPPTFQGYTGFIEFINYINKDMGRANGVSVESVKESSDWNCLCSCGAEAYFTGFSLECSRNCGSKVPDMSTVKGGF